MGAAGKEEDGAEVIVGTTENIYRNIYKDTSRRFLGLYHLLLVWRGSVFKLIWHDLLLFISAYAVLSVLYRTVLFQNDVAREWFEIVCVFAARFSQVIPIAFLTGFYVTQVVSRWWDQFMTLPFPDTLALRLVSFVPGKDNFRRSLRRTVMRYVNLSTIMVYRLVSEKVRKRFPTLDTLIEAKLLLSSEAVRLSDLDTKTPHESSWIPLLWAMKLLQRARSEKKIEVEAPIFASLISTFEYMERSHRKLLNYGWVNFPLAYTQVATLSVFTYFLAALFGRQYLIPRENDADHKTFPHADVTYASGKPFDFHTPDLYVPFFTLVELLSYLGWIKVAETLLNPFGDDDEDFKVNYMIDRNLQVSYLIVDEADDDVIGQEEDPFLALGITVPDTLPPFEYKGKLSKSLGRRSRSNVSRLNSVMSGHISEVQSIASTDQHFSKNNPLTIDDEKSDSQCVSLDTIIVANDNQFDGPLSLPAKNNDQPSVDEKDHTSLPTVAQTSSHS